MEAQIQEHKERRAKAETQQAILTKYLGTREAAEYIGVSPSYMAKLRMADSPERGPPYAKAQRRVIYRREDLDRWVASLIVDPRDESAEPQQIAA